MRTTFNIDNELMGRVRRLAAVRGVTITTVVEEAFRDLLAKVDTPPPEVPFDMPVVTGTHPPAIDLADRDALYERMDDRS